jgi:hypothetical protein
MFQGYLEKYKPGLRTNMFMERWVQVTSYSLLIFKDELAANCWGSKPFMTIPFHLVKHCERVLAKVHKSKDKPHQFEIFLIDEYMPTNNTPLI